MYEVSIVTKRMLVALVPPPGLVTELYKVVICTFVSSIELFVSWIAIDFKIYDLCYFVSCSVELYVLFGLPIICVYLLTSIS